MPIFKNLNKYHFGINQLFNRNSFCLPYEFTMSEKLISQRKVLRLTNVLLYLQETLAETYFGFLSRGEQSCTNPITHTVPYYNFM